MYILNYKIAKYTIFFTVNQVHNLDSFLDFHAVYKDLMFKQT